MKNQFKLFLLALITSALSYGQRHQIIKKTIDVNKNTSVILNFENVYVAIEESTDGKIHIDYLMEFEGFSKKNIQKKLDQVMAEVSDFDNHVTLRVKSEQQLTFETITFKTDHGIALVNGKTGVSLDSIAQKSKDSLLKEIKNNNKTRQAKNALKFINGKFKKMDKNGNLSDIKMGNIDIMRSQLLVKIPPFIKLNINGKNAGIHFRNNSQNELAVSIKQGTLKTKALTNTFNAVRIDNANFEAEAVLGGNYNFKHVKNGKIGSIDHAKIESEFSKIEIGEIGKNSTINDFNSEYWFYNWADNFERFNLYSEYSKINFWYSKQNISFKVIGNNTKNIVDNGKFQIDMQPTSKGEKYTMMVKKADLEKPITGEIFFDIVHGIIYSRNDSIKTINTN